MINMEKGLELVKETVVEEMEAVKEIKEEIGTKELLKAYGKSALEGLAIGMIGGIVLIKVAEVLKRK